MAEEIQIKNPTKVVSIILIIAILIAITLILIPSFSSHLIETNVSQKISSPDVPLTQ